MLDIGDGIDFFVKNKSLWHVCLVTEIHKLIKDWVHDSMNEVAVVMRQNWGLDLGLNSYFADHYLGLIVSVREIF